MSLPSSRNTTYVAADPVLSADLNAIQDCIVGSKRGDFTLIVHPSMGWADPANWAMSASGYMLSAAAGALYIPIPLITGDRIKEVTFALYGDGAADLTSSYIKKLTSAGVLTDISPSFAQTNPAAAWADVVCGVTDTTLAAGDSIFAYLTCNAAALRVGALRCLADHP